MPGLGILGLARMVESPGSLAGHWSTPQSDPNEDRDKRREVLPWWLFALVGILLGWLGIMLAASLTAGSSVALSHVTSVRPSSVSPSAPVISPRLPSALQNQPSSQQNTSVPSSLPPPVVTKIVPPPVVTYYVYPSHCNSPGAALAGSDIPAETCQQVGLQVSH